MTANKPSSFVEDGRHSLGGRHGMPLARSSIKGRIRPFVYATPSVGRTGVVTLVCLAVMVIFLAIEHKIAECALVAGCVLGCAGAAVLPVLMNGRLLLHYTRPKRSVVLSHVVEGIITGFILPSSFSPFNAFLLTFVFTVAGRSLATRTSAFSARSCINVPVLTACTAWIIGAKAAPAVLYPVNVWDSAITETLNNNVFSIFGITVPDGYMSLFWSAPEGAAICSEFNIITILSSLVLFSCNMANGAVTGIFLFVYLALVRFCGAFFGASGAFNGGDMIFAALTGGTLFCAVFVISRPGTMPMSRLGRMVYAVLCGVLAFFIAGARPGPRSIPFAILAGNVVSILLHYIEDLFIDFAAHKKLI